MAKRPFEGVSEGRRRNMQSNKSKDTKPELLVRRLLHGLGYRYSLHRHDLPGRPDLVFPSRKAIVEVRGCFWHGHGCALGQLPKSRQDYWSPKLRATRKRDVANKKALEKAGWRVYEVWECDLRAGASTIIGPLQEFLGPPRSQNLATYRESLERPPAVRRRDKGGRPPY